MPWYLPWSESIKKRACRYLLQRYLGQFLEEKLTLDQLTVDLYNGIGSVSYVKLDVQALNELGEQQNLPVEFVDGYISEMSVSIPWASLLSDSSYVEVNGLLLTVQPKQRADTGVSMFESMWSSMSSSMQIAEECLKQSSEGSKDPVDQGQPLEGLELFAQTIDSILSRVKVKFVNTTIRLEHVPKESNTGVAIELRIKNIDYFDEAGSEPPMSSLQQQQQASKVYQVATFTTKSFYMEGVVLYTDEFPSRARTFSRSVMSLSTSSSPESKLSEGVLGSPLSADSALPKQETSPLGDRDSMSSSRHSDMSSSERSVPGGNVSLEPDPVAFGRLVGRQELRLRLKQSEVAAGPKVQLEASCGSLLLFLSARQLHLLLELLEGLAAPHLEDTSNVAPRAHCMEKPMEAVDFRRVEQELQQQLLPATHLPSPQGLQGTQGWSTAALEDSDSEEEFLPMGPGMSESVLSEASSMATSTCSSASSYTGKGSHRYATPCASFAQSSAFMNQARKKSHKGPGGVHLGTEMGVTEVSRFHMRLASLAMVLLHEDVLTACADPGADGTLARSSVQQMKSTADNFFQGLGQFGSSSFGGKDFAAARDVFLGACHLNHIRLLTAPLVLEGSERVTAQGSSLAGSLTATQLELLECLVDKTSSQQVNVEYVELLKFPGNVEETPQTFAVEPCLKLQYKYCERVVQQGPSKRLTQPRTDISITLQPCCSEIDVSIVDRITAVLNPQPLCRRSVNKFVMSGMKSTMNQQACFYQAMETTPCLDSRTSIKVSSPFLTLKLRFPTPDLRPIHDMDRPPWWKRSVRKDFVTFELTDATFTTTVDSHEASQRYEIQCQELHGLFEEADTDTSVSFARASADDKNGNPMETGSTGSTGGCPRLVVTVYPVAPAAELEDAMDQDSDEGGLRQSTMDPMDGGPPEPSPFSSKRVVHESDTPHSRAQPSNQPSDTPAGEELIIPGDKQEMAAFIEHASQHTRLHLDITLPSASVHLPSKHLYELIYNRINTDMFLWEPSAPKPQAGLQVPMGDMYNTRTAGGVELSTFLQDTLYTTFSMCKSGIQYESDSDSEDAEGVYYSVYEQRQRQRRRQQLVATPSSNQSHTALNLTVGQGALSVFAPVRDSGGNVIPGQHGELLIQFEEGNLFSVSGYRGKSGLGYICLQVHQAAFYHNGLVPTPQEPAALPVVGGTPPAHLQPTIYRSEPGVYVGKANSNVAPGQDMLSVAIKVQLEDSLHHLKTFRVAAGLRGATLRHRTCPSSHSWFTQFVDFFDVIDYPIAGYDPPGVITELQLHLWGCAVDYRPVHLPLRALIAVGSFSVASNIAAQTSTSTLRFIAEEAALFLSDQADERPVELRKDYVCVVDLGLFELSLRLCSQQSSGGGSNAPRVDLRASNNVLHVRTCADSGKALTELLTYFASDGDLKSTMEEGSGGQVPNSGTGEAEGHEGAEAMLMAVGNDNEDNGNSLSQSQVAHVHTMMEEAMKESSIASHRAGPPRSSRNRRGVEVFFFPDEANVLASKALADSELFQKEETEEHEDSWEDEFCILDKEAGSGFLPRNSLPEVRVLTSEPLRLIDNHFAVPLGKTDLLRAPKGYPAAVLRYTLREMTVVWHMYGGHDFGPAPVPTPTPSFTRRTSTDDHRVPECKSCPSSPPCSSPRGPRGSQVSFSKSTPTEVHFAYQYPPTHSPRANSPPHLQQQHFQPQPQLPQMSWQVRGGPGRRHDVLMELQLNKVRFQHEVYPETAPEASRQVLLVSDVELRDRLASSQINKFLYQYSSEARPKQSHANMIVIKAVHVRPDPRLRAQECSLRVSLLPLRLNIDQDSLLFLFGFFSDISGRKTAEDETSSSGSTGGLSGGTPRHSTPTHAPPVMTVNVEARERTVPPEPQALLIFLEDELSSTIGAAEDESLHAEGERHSTSAESASAGAGGPSAPIFFRSFVFTPDVPIRLDYQGKRVDMTHGPLAGLLMGLGQLNCSELRLKRLSHRHGLLGFDKLVAYALSEWLRDIKKHQLPSLLGGVGPLHALVQLFQGVRDLFWLPIEQYQKDGRIVRGLQRGANSFTTSTAMAALELTNRLVQAIQTTAELAYDMVSPGPSVRCLRAGRATRGGRRRRRLAQPADIREGVANALTVMREGLGETAQALVRAASEEHELKGVSGAVGGVLRQIPPTALKPILLATEATANVLGGMRSQLAPDVRREAQDKWRLED